MMAPGKPGPAACIHSPHLVTWAGTCLSLHPHVPERSGKSDLVLLLTTWRRAGWTPGSAGRAEALPA